MVTREEHRHECKGGERRVASLRAAIPTTPVGAVNPPANARGPDLREDRTPRLVEVHPTRSRVRQRGRAEPSGTITADHLPQRLLRAQLCDTRWGPVTHKTDARLRPGICLRVRQAETQS